MGLFDSFRNLSNDISRGANQRVVMTGAQHKSGPPQDDALLPAWAGDSWEDFQWRSKGQPVDAVIDNDQCTAVYDWATAIWTNGSFAYWLPEVPVNVLLVLDEGVDGPFVDVQLARNDEPGIPKFGPLGVLRPEIADLIRPMMEEEDLEAILVPGVIVKLPSTPDGYPAWNCYLYLYGDKELALNQALLANFLVDLEDELE